MSLVVVVVVVVVERIVVKRNEIALVSSPFRSLFVFSLARALKPLSNKNEETPRVLRAEKKKKE